MKTRIEIYADLDNGVLSIQEDGADACTYCIPGNSLEDDIDAIGERLKGYLLGY